MDRIFQTFIDSLAASSDERALRLTMEAAAAAVDLACFAYLALPRAAGGRRAAYFELSNSVDNRPICVSGRGPRQANEQGGCSPQHHEVGSSYRYFVMSLSSSSDAAV